jgi:hypothetical protein
MIPAYEEHSGLAAYMALLSVLATLPYGSSFD